MLSTLPPIEQSNYNHSQPQLTTSYILIKEHQQVELEPSMVENLEKEEQLIFQEQKKQTFKKLKGRKWNRKIHTLDDLPPLNEADFLEESSERQSVAIRDTIKVK
jgi:hypothetical protein